ncbi:MAG: chromate efflux transporter [Chthoniobacteraceae bacterium]
MEKFSKLTEIFKAFLKLGLISFGGPVAHLGYFREEFVHRRKWLDDAAFGDLVALCQFLPGPASSQVVFALGMRRAGVAGAFTASFCFTMPSAVLMILFAYGIGAFGDLRHAGWLHGLKLAAVAVVAQAVWGMGRNLCPDLRRKIMALAAAAFVLLFPGAFSQIAAIAMGAMIGWWIYRDAVQGRDVQAKPGRLGIRAHVSATVCLVVFFTLLVALPLLAAAIGSETFSVFDSFYRAGSLVFGGGHVVLPLLRAEVVPRGWMSDDTFLAGYGAAQALPGPLFTFAAYLGTVMHPGPWAWLRGLIGLFAIFLPAWLLVGGALPFWEELRKKSWMQATLRGGNAAVVGVLLAALYNPVITTGIRNAQDVAVALIAFALLEYRKTPPWLVVILAAIAGQFLLP